MNREILFRGFHADECGADKVYIGGECIKGKWVEGVPYGEYMICGMTTAYYDDEVPMSKYVEFDYLEVIPETVGQYSGFKDGKHADGKEIYQGDKCRDNKGYIVEIEWDNEHFMLMCKVTKGGTLVEGLSFPLWHFNDCQMNGYRYLEVIGNIFTNPELLE